MGQCKTTYNGETFTHRVLWDCCRQQMKAATNATKGARSFHIAAMLMAYLAYEAYLNYVGSRVAPDAWENEQDFFSQTGYRGTEGKLRKILEVCGLKQPNKGNRPYQTLSELKSLRNFLAHGKLDSYQTEQIHHRDIEPPLFPQDTLDKSVTPKKAERALEDTEKFIEFLHESIRPHINDIWFGDKALGGISQHCSSDTHTLDGTL